MDQLEALRRVVHVAEARGMPEDPGSQTGLSHLRSMLERVEASPEDFSEAKLGRWLGWAQCSLVSAGLSSLAEAKELNASLAAEEPRPFTKQVIEADPFPFRDPLGKTRTASPGWINGRLTVHDPRPEHRISVWVPGTPPQAQQHRDQPIPAPTAEQIEAGVHTVLEAMFVADVEIPRIYPKSRALTVLTALRRIGWRPVAEPEEEPR